MDFDQLTLGKFQHWTLFLNQNQSYLGRMYLWANRENAIDFIQTTREEREEFFHIAEAVRSALNALFLPDLINYAALGNVCSHLHVHIIPRYKNKRNFCGIDFIDKRWGSNYAPYDKNFKTDIVILKNMKEKIIKTMDFKIYY